LADTVALITSEMAAWQDSETDESIKDDLEGMIVTSLGFLTEVMKSVASYFLPDFLTEMIGVYLSTDLTKFDMLYDSLSVLLRTILLSGNERTPEIVNLIAMSLQQHEFFWGISCYFTEPLQAFIGYDFRKFLEIGISASLFEFCARLIGIIVAEECILGIGGLLGHIAFVDESINVRGFSRELRETDRIELQFVSLEIDIGAMVCHKEIEDELIDRMVAAVTDHWVVNGSHRRLFEVGFLVALGLDVALADRVLPCVVRLLLEEELLDGLDSEQKQEYWSEVPMPPDLAPLNVEQEWNSVYFCGDYEELVQRARVALQASVIVKEEEAANG
jgi:hypothetical protein